MWLVSFSPYPSLSRLSFSPPALSALFLSPPPTLTFYLPPPTYSLPSTFYPYYSYLPIPDPSTSLFPFRPALSLPSPAYLLSSTFYPYSFYLPIPTPSTFTLHPSVPSLFSLLLLLPFPFLSISAYTRTLSPTSPALSLPSPAYLLSSTFYPYSSYLYPLPPPPNPALHSLTLPISSPPSFGRKG